MPFFIINEFYKMELEEWKPMLSENVKFSKSGNSLVLNQEELGYQLKLNIDVEPFIRSLDGKKNLNELSNIYNEAFTKKIDEASLEKFLKSDLTSKGFIKSNLVLKKRPQASYIKYKITIIKSGFLKETKLEYLSAFFSKEKFYLLLILLFLSNLLIFFFYDNSTISSNSSQVIAIVFCSHIFHELGHAISAKCKNISSGPISFGFYYFLPVFFIDLSDAWNIKKSDRIIINLSGILIDYLFGIFLFICYKITNNNLFILSNILLFLKTFYNLNPFIRSDIYWVLADYFEKPNLSEQSRRALMKVFSNIKKMKSQPFTKSQIYMASYYFLTIIFWTYIIINFLKNVMNGFASSRLFLTTVQRSINTGVWDFSVLIRHSVNLLFLFFGVYILFVIIRVGIKKITRAIK